MYVKDWKGLDEYPNLGKWQLCSSSLICGPIWYMLNMQLLLLSPDFALFLVMCLLMTRTLYTDIFTNWTLKGFAKWKKEMLRINALYSNGMIWLVERIFFFLNDDSNRGQPPGDARSFLFCSFAHRFNFSRKLSNSWVISERALMQNADVRLMCGMQSATELLHAAPFCSILLHARQSFFA